MFFVPSHHRNFTIRGFGKNAKKTIFNSKKKLFADETTNTLVIFLDVLYFHGISLKIFSFNTHFDQNHGGKDSKFSPERSRDMID